MMHNNQKIPNGWSVKKLGDIGVFFKGAGITKNDLVSEGLPCIRYAELYTKYNFIIPDCVSFISEEVSKNAKPVHRGDILFAGSGETKEEIGKCAVYDNPVTAYAGGDNIIFRPEKDNSTFLSYFLNTAGRRYLNRLGQGDSIVHIHADNLKKVFILLPPLAEQKKIAEILGTWDEAIEKLSSLIEQKKLLKKGLMQKLLTGKVRLFKTSPLAGEVADLSAGEGLNNQQSESIQNKKITNTLAYRQDCPLTSPLAGEVADLSAGEGLDNNDNIKISSHRMYQPYIKEFSRDMRKNSTKAENLLWQKIRNGQLGFKFRRQHQIDNKYIADFICLEKRLIIELDGGQHNDRPKDKDRTLYLENNNFKVIRFWDNEILQNIDGCLEILLKEISLLNNPSPCPSPARGEGISATYSNSLPQGVRKNERFSQPWKEVKLGEIGTISSAGVDKKIVEGEDLVELLNYMDVYKKDFLYKTDTSMTVSAPMRQIKNCNLRKGDIFFTPSSETPDDIAHSAVVMEDIPNGVYSYHIIRLRPTTLIDLKFSAYAFKTAKFYKQAYAWCEGSGQRYVISQDDFRNMKIYIPSNISEQHAIAEVLSTADDEIDLLNKKLTLFKEQKKGLMQQLLTGNIRVKVN